MVRPTEPHRVLCKSNVLFLGYSEATPNALQLDALRDPLRKAYPVHATNQLEGINAYLTIYTSGMQLQLVDGNNPPVFWFPIQNLYIAAANKCVNYLDPATGALQESKFVELANSDAQASSHAPLFSFISQQFKGTQTQCYTFMTKSDEAAFALVESAKFAHDNKSGHTQDRIPSEIAAEEIVSDGDSDSEMSGTPNVINVDSLQRDSDNGDMFPRRLVKRQRLEFLRNNQSFRRNEPNGQFRQNQSINRSAQPSIRMPPPIQPGSIYGQRPPIRPPPVAQEKIKVVQPPPMYIRAPPPKVVYVKEPPKIVQTPPQIIRQVVEVDRPVERIKEVPVYIKSEPEIIERKVEVKVPVQVEVPVPYPVPGPAPPPEIIEREVRVDVPVEVQVPYPVRSRTPPPQYIEVPVPVEVRGPTPPPRIIEIPVPYEVRSPTPPPQIIEVPVQIPIYIESEPQIIREPPQIQEIPVPYPVEIPYQVPVEVPHPFPVPLRGRSSRKTRRSERREYYNDQLLDRRRGPGYFAPEFPDLGYEVRRDNRAERSRRRSRHRSSSSDSSPANRRDYRNRRDHGLSNGLSGIRITEVDDRGRPLREDYSPRRDQRDDRRQRSREREDADGYDFYRPSVDGRRRDRNRGNDDAGDYRVKVRRSPRDQHRSKDRREFSPSSFSGHPKFASRMPAHLSDSASDLPAPPISSRSRNNAYYY